jgi:hypothetical protein
MGLVHPFGDRLDTRLRPPMSPCAIYLPCIRFGSSAAGRENIVDAGKNLEA